MSNFPSSTPNERRKASLLWQNMRVEKLKGKRQPYSHCIDRNEKQRVVVPTKSNARQCHTVGIYSLQWPMEPAARTASIFIRSCTTSTPQLCWDGHYNVRRVSKAESMVNINDTACDGSMV